MNTSTKKGLILCDYCGLNKDSSQIYTAKKLFAGCKIVDILQTITKRNIPATAAIKLCSMCASTLHAATGAIEKAAQMVNKLMDTKVNESDAELNGSNKKADKVATQAKQRLLSNSNSDAKQLTPKKQNAKDNLDESLNNAVKLTSANEGNKKYSEVRQLFGYRNANDSDSEEEPEDVDDVEVVSSGSEVKNILIGFACKLCDFVSTYPVPMKNHYKEVHKQQRPRVFNCLKCTKSFGVLKSLKTHLLTHGMVEEKSKKKEEKSQLDKTQEVQQKAKKKEEKPQQPKKMQEVQPEVQQDELEKTTGPQLAVLKALQPKKKPLETVPNAEYTFAIEDTNSSTPKPVVEKAVPANQCDICHLDHASVKRLQEHLKSDHNIDRPRLFKCGLCVSEFMHKATLDRHIKNKHDANTNPGSPLKRRNTVEIDTEAAVATAKKSKSTPKRRKTIAIEPATVEKPFQVKLPVKVTKITSKTDKIEKAEKATSPKKLADKFNTTQIEKVDDKSSMQTDITDFMVEICDNIDLISMGSSQTKVDHKAEESVDVEQITKNKSPKKSKSPLKKSRKVSEMKIDENESFAFNKQKESADFKQEDMEDVEFISMEDMMANSSQMNITKVSTKKERKFSEHNDLTLVPVDSPNKSISNGIPKKDKSIATATKIKTGKKQKKVEADTEEVNKNVKPHKREMLETSAFSESELSCHVCGKIASSRKRLDSHTAKKHSLTCRNCQETYPDSMQYIGHFEDCDASKGLPCGIKTCTKKFSGAHYLDSHLKEKHNFS